VIWTLEVVFLSPHLGLSRGMSGWSKKVWFKYWLRDQNCWHDAIKRGPIRASLLYVEITSLFNLEMVSCCLLSKDARKNKNVVILFVLLHEWNFLHYLKETVGISSDCRKNLSKNNRHERVEVTEDGGRTAWSVPSIRVHTIMINSRTIG